MKSIEELYADMNAESKLRQEQIAALAKREGITPEEWKKRNITPPKKGAMMFRPAAIEIVEDEAED